MERILTTLLLLAVLLTTGVVTLSQEVDVGRIEKAGQYLQEFSSQWYTGYWVQTAGSALVLLGALVNLSDPLTGSLFMVTGFVITAIGGWIQYVAYERIGQAGAELARAKR